MASRDHRCLSQNETWNMDKRKVNKRRRTVVEDVAASVDLEEGNLASVDLEEGWLAKFLELPGDKLAKLLGGIANHGKITTSAIKKARTSLPSFSGVKWTTFAEQFGLPDSLEENTGCLSGAAETEERCGKSQNNGSVPCSHHRTLSRSSNRQTRAGYVGD